MIADTDLQVWLDSQPNAGQTTIVPYIKSTREMQLHYQLSLIQSGNSGTSRISQGGTVDLRAQQPTALSRLALSPNKGGGCSIDLALRDGERELGNYHFDCPR